MQVKHSLYLPNTVSLQRKGIMQSRKPSANTKIYIVHMPKVTMFFLCYSLIKGPTSQNQQIQCIIDIIYHRYQQNQQIQYIIDIYHRISRYSISQIYIYIIELPVVDIVQYIIDISRISRYRMRAWSRHRGVLLHFALINPPYWIYYIYSFQANYPVIFAQIIQ